jgi:hypothetical protein
LNYDKNRKQYTNIFIFCCEKKEARLPFFTENITEQKKINMKKTMKALSVQEIRQKYPNRIPIHVTTSTDIVLDKAKYLVPDTLTFGGFMIVLRKRIQNLGSEEALFLFVKGILPANNQLISMYAKSLIDNEMIMCELCKENTFG